tara:strand:- start:545 stop:721 length:177 start_codon:yes stop_codon:yes gene_type:complete
MSKSKTPELGDKIEHICTLNGKFEGEVVQLLSMQFIYKTAKGHLRHCMFKEQWKKLDD